MTITSAASASRWAASKRPRDGDPDSSSPSTKTVDADRRLAAVRPKRRQMRCDTGLVVGAAPAVQPPVALGRLEGRRVPLAAVAFGLYVVVRVQQHRGRARGRGMPGDHGGRAAFADDTHIAKTGLGQQVRYRLGAAVYLIATGWIGPRDSIRTEILEVSPD